MPYGSFPGRRIASFNTGTVNCCKTRACKRIFYSRRARAFSGGLPITALLSQIMIGRSMRMGCSTMAANHTSVGVSSDNPKLLKTASPRRTNCGALICSLLSVACSSFTVGGNSRYFNTTGAAPACSRRASA